MGEQYRWTETFISDVHCLAGTHIDDALEAARKTYAKYLLFNDRLYDLSGKPVTISRQAMKGDLV